MKRMTGILIIAALLAGALFTAQAGTADAKQCTITEIKEQAAPGWQKTYEAHGRTIVVDIPIQVPETDMFPALVAVPMPPADGIPITDWHGHVLASDKFFNEAGFFRWDSPTGEIKTEAAQKNLKDPPRGMDVMPVVRKFNQLEWDAAYAYNNTYTVRDADTLMKTKWNAYFPNEKIVLMPHWVHARGEMRFYDEKTDTYSGDPWPEFQAPLMVYFDQVIRGIPLLCYPSDSFAHYAGMVKKEIRGYAGGIAIIQGMKDIGLEGMYYSMQYSLLKEQQELLQDVPLCGLDRVIGTFEQLIAKGKLRTVASLRLGYVAWYNKGEPESYTLLPTWVLEGELFQKANTERQRPLTQNMDVPGEYGPILVNAQTGELIDPWNASPDRSFDKPDILPWK